MKQLNRFIYLLERKSSCLPGETRDLLTNSIDEEIEILRRDCGITDREIRQTAYLKGLGEALFNI